MASVWACRASAGDGSPAALIGAVGKEFCAGYSLAVTQAVG